MAIVRLVRPWYAWSSTAMPTRPVCLRAILTPFSTASAPELTSTLFLAKAPGVCSARSSATRTYSSYGVIVKSVWSTSPSCSRAAATTVSTVCPTVVTPMPAPRSMKALPSTSSTIAPCARVM
jgi:hypothetical protein